MNYPSVKTIMTRLAEPLRKVSLENFSAKRAAVMIRALMMGADTPARVDHALDEINEVLEGYGVESWKDDGWIHYYLDTAVLYVNMGDTYCPTVCYDTRKDRWLVCSWGDLVEKNQKRFIG